MEFKITKSFGRILKEKGIDENGRVQKFIDSEVIRRCKPLVPFRSGILESSADKSDIGSGLVVWETPNAKKQYKENKGQGLRGKLWFERMKASQKDDIVRGARKYVEW